MSKQTFTTGQVLTAAQMTSLQQTAMGGGSTTAKTTSYVLVAADAGTVVQMNAAGATTITVNTALFAAGDTVQIQNVGAGVCTVTAGTATVSTSSTLALKQYDSGDLYFNTTSAAFFFSTDAADSTSPLTTKGDLYGFSTLDARIPIGANNTILTADSAQALGLKWATPATSSPSWSLLSTTAISTGSSYSITGLSGYNQLMVRFAGISSTTADSFQATFNSVTTGNAYFRTGEAFNGAAAFSTNYPGTVGTAAGNNLEMGGIAAAANTLSGYLFLQGGNGAGLKVGHYVIGGSDAASGAYHRWLGFTYTDANVISSLQFSLNFGAFDAGSIYIYGSVI